MNKKSIILISVLIVICSIFLYGCTKGNSAIQVKLIDSSSGKAISNTDVKIYSDNGIRCITAPCPTEGKEWKGKSDSDGLIFVPKNIINVVTTITATGYENGKDIGKDSKKISDKEWTMELDSDEKVQQDREKFLRCNWMSGDCKNICLSQNYYFDGDIKKCKKYLEPNLNKGCCTTPPFETIAECEVICE